MGFCVSMSAVYSSAVAMEDITKEKAVKPSGTISKLLGVAIGCIVLAVILSAMNGAGESEAGSPDTSQDNTDLNLSVSANDYQISITNKEASDLTDCEVGVNSTSGWDADKPPYKTHGGVNLPAGKAVIIETSQLTTDNGTRFQGGVQAVNSVYIGCSLEEGVYMRSWFGGPNPQ